MSNRAKSAKESLQEIMGYFEEQAGIAESCLIESCRACKDQDASKHLCKLLLLHRKKHVLEDVIGQVQETFTVPAYIVSTMFLQGMFSDLNHGEDEDLRFVTGLRLGTNCLTLERSLAFKLRVQSPIAAVGDQSSVDKVLLLLHNANHKLHGTFHIHPGSGPGATAPSPTDLDFHARLEAGKYPVVGCIYSRSGHFRFFSYQREFDIRIYGKGVDTIDEHSHIFCLSKSSEVESKGLLGLRRFGRNPD